MKFYSFLPATLFGMFLFCMASCGEQNDQKDDVTSDSMTNDTTAATKTTAPSTIVTTPQNMMIVRHKVADFDKWLASYEAHDSIRLANGVHSYVIGRGVTDPNMILVATKVGDIEKAKAFGKSSQLKQAMQKAGVTGKPDIRFTTMTYQDTGIISADLRSRTTFTVKNWDNWQRSFDSSRQVRIDNGLIDRAYGHDADDNKKVTLVVAVTDTAKANAFWKSDQLKQLRARSGAMGEPERFLFRVVKRY
jgi:hypothetical protein